MAPVGLDDNIPKDGSLPPLSITLPAAAHSAIAELATPPAAPVFEGPPVKNQLRTGPDAIEEVSVIPLADALRLADSESHIEARIQSELERQGPNFELDRQRLEFLEQQQQQATQNQQQQEQDHLQQLGNRQSILKVQQIDGIIIVVAVALVAVVATVAGVCGSGNCREKPFPQVPGPVPTTPAPTATQTTSRANSIITYINSITLTNQILRYPSNATAEERALQWLIDVDFVTDESNTLALRQRYALGTLWFQAPTGFDDAVLAETWATDNAECDWEDVFCNREGHVTNLYLAASGVQGRIPNDLGLLTDLTRLDFTGLGFLFNNVDRNVLTGTIPTTLGSLTALTSLVLTNNGLTGTIPSSLRSLTDLKSLILSINHMTGTIPPTLGSMTALESLSFSNNAMTGPIPSSFGSLTALKAFLILKSNALTGTIPSSLGSLTALELMWLDNNDLTGTIPSTLASLTALTRLHLYNNAVTGTMPFCSLNQSFVELIADCDKVICPCCTHCCPSSRDGIPQHVYCSFG